MSTIRDVCASQAELFLHLSTAPSNVPDTVLVALAKLTLQMTQAALDGNQATVDQIRITALQRLHSMLMQAKGEKE